MRKLNKKGFTLVELLAVIIILAVVVGITIPAVMTTTNNAKKSAFKTAADVAANWFEREYQSYLIGNTTIAPVDANYTAVCTTVNCKSTNGLTGVSLTSAAIVASGLKAADVKSSASAVAATMTATLGAETTTSYVMINTNTGRACVKLVSNGANYPSGAVACGGVCNSTQCTAKGV